MKCFQVCISLSNDFTLKWFHSHIFIFIYTPCGGNHQCCKYRRQGQQQLLAAAQKLHMGSALPESQLSVRDGRFTQGNVKTSCEEGHAWGNGSSKWIPAKVRDGGSKGMALPHPAQALAGKRVTLGYLCLSKTVWGSWGCLLHNIARNSGRGRLSLFFLASQVKFLLCSFQMGFQQSDITLPLTSHESCHTASKPAMQQTDCLSCCRGNKKKHGRLQGTGNSCTESFV